MSNSNKNKVVIFVGEDITAHLILNSVLKQIEEKGLQPVLYFAKHIVTANARLDELKEFALHDRILLNEVVYPFIDKQPSVCARNMSPQQMVDVYNAEHAYVPNVNDPDFVESIKERNDICCAISIRSTQIFRKPLVDAINKDNPDGIFFNLHSGILPDFRGVMPTMRAMFAYASGQRKRPPQYGVTLHKVDSFDPDKKDRGIDTGNVIEVMAMVNNDNPTAFAAQTGLVKTGEAAIRHLIESIVGGFNVIGHPQNEEMSGYYTFPTREEIDQWKSHGIVLCKDDETVSTLVGAFSKAGTSHGKELENKLKRAIKNWGKKEGTVANVQVETTPANNNAPAPGLSAMMFPILAASR